MRHRFATRLLHEAFPPDKTTGATTASICQTTAFAQETAENMAKIFTGRKPGFVYTRVGNPTLTLFERRLAALEEGVGALSFASGMAAVSMSVMNIVGAGDEIVASGSLFGGTSSLFRDLASYGVHVRYAEENHPDAFAACLTEKTKLIYTETLGNPKLDVADIGALAEVAHTHGLPLFVDNTVTTPYLVRPLSLGADVVIHSTSKAINGNGNSVGGIVVVGKFPWNAEKFPKLKEFSAFGAMSYLARLGACMRTDYGSSLSPFNAYLTGIGLDTLALRMERACENAMALANYLRSKDTVTVNYPGLPDHPGHELARRQFSGRYGTMLTLRLGSQERAFRFINHLSLALNVSNIGDARTLVIHPWSTIYLHASEEEKARAGVTDDLVRVSVGIEDKDDLLDDFEQALEKSQISEKQEDAVSKPKIYKSVTELIGGTPLLRAVNFEKANAVEANLLVKLEFFNPAGSVKDRIAKAMIEKAEQEGKLKEGSVIVEPTSGNTGIGLASVAAARGYRTILTMPETMSVERRNLLKAYGAEIVLTEGYKGMKGVIAKAEEIAKETPNAFIPSQFTNQANPAAHEATTGPEIWRDTDGEVDLFVAGVGTGGTLTGVGRYLKRQKRSVKIIAVEPLSSPVLSQGKVGPHKIQGIGAGFVPETLDTSVYDEVLPISNEDAFKYGRQFARTEGVLVGISSGAALAAAVKLAARDEFKGKTIVALLPDTGDRYLSTGLFSE